MGGFVTGVSDYCYLMNTIVVVSGEARVDDKAIWIGKIVSILKVDSGKVS